MNMEIGDIHIDVERKAIRHIYLSVHAPEGRVHVSAPIWMQQRDIETFVLRKQAWIERQRQKIMARPKPTEHHYISGESCYVFGQRLTLEVTATREERPSVCIADDKLFLTIRPETNETQRAALIHAYLRQQLGGYLAAAMAYWRRIMGEANVTWSMRKMRSEWGSWTPRKRKLLFNLELAHVPKGCIDYIVVHELSHLRVPNHSRLFYARVEEFMPDWRERRRELKGAMNAYRL